MRGNSDRNADLKLPGVAESGEMAEPVDDVGSHESQLGGAGGIATGDHDHRAAHVADPALLRERPGQHGVKLSGPVFLIAGLPQKTL